jgi:hypothetical protein
MKIYVIKIAVRGVSPMVWRRLRIAADTSLAALHFIFQIVQGWGDDYLHQFHIHGKDFGISYDGGIGFPDNPFRLVIDDFAFDAGDRFTYEYNFFEHWLHDIRVEAIHEDSTLRTPFCMSGHGRVTARIRTYLAISFFDIKNRFLYPIGLNIHSLRRLTFVSKIT